MFEDDLDDSYLIEALETIDNINNKTVENVHQPFETPPNSETVQSIMKYYSPEIDKTESTSISESDFRSRLLRTISDRKNKASHNSQNIGTEFRTNCQDYVHTDAFSLEATKEIESTEKDVHNFNLSPVSNTIYSPTSLRSTSDVQAFSMTKSENLNRNNNLPTLIRKRKFPGPAGLLPSWPQATKSLSSLDHCDLTEPETKPSSVGSMETVCSQNAAQEFIYGSWKKMILDFDDMVGCSPIQDVNIRWLLRRVTFSGETVAQKISFLVVMVRSIDASHFDASVVFRDETGEINGIITGNVIDKYNSIIAPGTVFVLRDVTVLSPSGFRMCVSLKGQLHKHYLNVTLNSILYIYFTNDIGKVTKTDVVKLNREELKSLLTSNKCSGPKTVIEENEQDNENSELTLFSDALCSYSEGEVSCQKLPTFGNPLPLTTRPVHAQQNNLTRFINPLNKSCSRADFPDKATARTFRPNISNALNEVRPNNSTNLEALVSTNTLFSACNTVKCTSQVKLRMLPSDKKSQQNRLNGGVSNVTNLGSCVMSSLSSSSTSTSVSTLQPGPLPQNKPHFRFVNKSLLDSAPSMPTVINAAAYHAGTSLITFSQDAQSALNEGREKLNLNAALSNPNKKIKSDDFSGEDDIDLLLSSIDTDALV